MRRKITQLVTIALSLIFTASVLSAQYSNATFNGPWVVVGQNYIIFDGNGHIMHIGSSCDTASAYNTYSVTQQGVFSATLNETMASTYYLNGALVSDTAAVMMLDSSQGPWNAYAVTNPAALSGTWNGYIFDSTTMGAWNIQLELNTIGNVTSAAGISLVAGSIFEARDTFNGYITTNDSDCSSKFLQIWGNYSGDSLYGQTLFGPMDHGNPCVHRGSVQLTRIATGVSAIESDLDFAAYPNPYIDQLEIDVKNTGSKIQVDLFDVLGRKTDFGNWDAVHNIRLYNLGSMNPGTYLLRLTSHGKSVTRRIVKI